MINKTVLICEGGLFSSWAERLSREYKRVLLFRPWTRTFSHPNDYHIGRGYESFERVEHFWEHVDEVDTVVFLDIHFPDWADYLRKQGKRVWSAFYGEELELARIETKALLKNVGLPTGDYEVVEGVDSLRSFLKHHDNTVVKIPKLRGLTETFTAENYDLIRIKLEEIEHKLGGASTKQKFIVEHKIEALVESGYDGWCIDGKFPRTAVVGCEIKDCGSASKVTTYDRLPKEVQETNSKLSSTLRSYGYRGFFSTEIRVTKDSFYPIDFTCRAASPCGENLQELFSNLGEVIEGGVDGVIVEPKPAFPYAAQAMITSAFADENWLPIEIPPNVRQWFKLYHSCVIDGQEYIVPTGVDMEEIGSVVGVGQTLDAAIKRVEELAGLIHGYQVKVELDALAEAKEELEKVTG